MRYARFRRFGPALAGAALIAFGVGAMAVGSTGHGVATSNAKHKKVKRGPRGKQGRPGPRGPAGARGLTGPIGPIGPIGPSNVFAAINNGPTTSAADGVERTVATLANLPAGAYAIFAKANITRLAGGIPGVGGCTLTAEGDSDGANTTLQNGLSIGSTVSTELTHTFAAAGTVSLSCTANGGTSQWLASQNKIIALKVGSETRTIVTG